MVSARPLLFVTLYLILAAGGCGAVAADVKASPETGPGCAVIVTDDDIPSGSATAGALFVAEAALGKKLLTADVVAVARGFRAAGVRCVEVVDSHDGAIDPAPLAAMGVPVLTPSNLKKDWTWPFFGPMHLKPRSMAALVGYHSPAGSTDGFRAHTINDNVKGLWINGKPAGEVSHLILGLSALGVPVVLVTGDHNATAEAARLIPKIEQVTVRWRGPKGEAKFLSQAEAGARLASAARRAAGGGRRPAAFSRPLRLDLEILSARMMRDRSRSLAADYRALIGTMPGVKKLLGPFDFASASMKVSGRRLSWRADDGQRAFVSVAFAASYLRGKRNWGSVSKGFRAFSAGKYSDAVAAYRRALKENPYDEATRCRMAAALAKLGRLAEAHRLFSRGVKHRDELGSHQMEGWCLTGLASAEVALGHPAAAAKHARALLALPDHRGRHAEAKALLRAAGCLQRAPKARDVPTDRPTPRFELRCRDAEFRFVCGKLETVYSYLDTKQKRHGFAYAMVKEEARRAVAAATNEIGYRAAMNRMLKRFNDGHLRINYRPPPGQKKKAGKLPPAVTHRWLPGRVLLTRIRRLWGDPAPIRKALTVGLKKLGRARALVVDLRGNGGGDDALAFDYITRLVARPIPLGRISLRISAEVMGKNPGYARMFKPDPARPGYTNWWVHTLEPKTKKSFAGPVAVLIDRGCYSSCEGTALAFKNSGLARLYGQATGGGSANPVLIDLPVTAGKLMVPTWIQVMPDGKLLEDNGVAPDVVLPPGQDAQKRALTDIRRRLQRGRGWR